MKRKPKKKLDPLDKMLEHHLRMCTYFIYSGDRHCSCGRDEAIKQLAQLRAIAASVQQSLPMEQKGQMA